MTVIELLAQLSEKNVELSVKGEDLVVRGGERVLEAPELLELLRKNKKALVEHIKAGRYVDPKGIVQVPPNRIPPACEAITPEMLPLAPLTQEEIESIVAGVPGGAANVQDIYPLTALQEGILFHHLMAAGGDPYIQSVLLSFDSRARLDGFVRALQMAVARHDILRTAVVWEGLPEPAQVVWREAPLRVEEVSLDADAGDIAEQLRARFNPREYRLDVRRAPMMRLLVAEDTANRRWIALYSYHHLVDDITTLKYLMAEVGANLRGQVEHTGEPLPFRNFVAQARLGVSREEHEAYFREMLGDVEEPTAPYGLLDAQGDGMGIEEARMALERSVGERLRERARALGVSAASLCHVAWGQVLGRVSGREDVVFGTVLFGRMGGVEGAEQGLGMFINTLPIRVPVGAESVERCVRRTHELLGELMRHEHASLALAQRCSAVAAPAPLFTALLNYRYGAGAAEVHTEARHAWEGIEFLGGEERTNYPISLNLDDLGEGFSLNAQAQSPIDPDRICAYMHRALEQLLEALERAPATAVRDLDALPASERRQMLVEWNATRIEYPRDQFIHELFEAQAARRAECVAAAHEDSHLSYGELNVRANRLAHHLRKQGVQPDTRVALCVERSLEMVVGLLAILKAGGAYVPLDPAYPVERLTYMLADSASAVVLTHAQAQIQIRSTLAQVGVPTIDLAGDTARWESEPGLNLTRASIGLTPEHLAYVIYTSGSTGVPKAVGNTISGLCNRLSWFIESVLEEAPVMACKTSIGFVDSVTETLETLVAGGTLVMFDSLTVKDTSLFARGIERFTVSNLTVVPSLLGHLLEIGPSAFRSLKTLICSGERLAPELAHRVKSAYPHVRFFNFYGSSEVNGDSTAFECAGDMEAGRSIIGHPIANTRVYLLGADARPAPIGVAGKLFLGGGGLARGYLNRPDLTAERFVVDPFADEPGARMYDTGDLARYLPDGAVDYLGRNDFQVKIRGFRIELGEVEAAIAQHPQVKECAVIARKDMAGEQRLAAYVVTHETVGTAFSTETMAQAPSGALSGLEHWRPPQQPPREESLDTRSLRAYLKSRLPDYMLPAAITFLDSLPLTPNGKLNRQALPAPDASAHAPRGYEAPVGEIETTLAQIWANLLGLKCVGRHDNFFDLGGDSLLATRLIVRIRQEMKVEIGLEDLFSKPILDSLAEQVLDARLAQFTLSDLEDLATRL